MTEPMGVDKPFNCDVSGCGMRFTNEDHLTVHRKKHEMCLSLNSESNAKSNNMALFVDQTPTPTRFIRNCEEVGLFQDLQSLNPFEEHFRKAAESVKMGHPPISLHVPHDSDILNTPSILVSDLEDGTSLPAPLNVLNTSVPPAQLSLDDDDQNMVNKNEGIMKDTDAKDEDSKMEVVAANSSPEVFTMESKEPEVIEQDLFTSETTILPLLPPSQPVDIEVATDTPVTAATSNTVITLPSTDFPLTNVTEVQSSSSAVISNAQPLVQLILKLPDGSSIPVQFPALSSVLDTSSQSELIQQKKVTNSTQSNVSSSKNISNLAKVKLRETLTQGLSAGENRALRIMNEQIATSLAELQHSSSSSDSFSIQGSMSQNKRRFGLEDNDIKRQKFLERNRAAATRCRQKRKQWVESLESKADELAQVNQHLQNEVALLRTEVTHLKSMLLAHKDCPVTQQQQKNLATLNGSTTTLIVSGGTTKLVATKPAKSSTTPTTTTVADVSLISESIDRQSSPVVYRTIMSREQAIALLTGNSGVSATKTVAIRTASSTTINSAT